jgi:hypothetical protein
MKMHLFGLLLLAPGLAAAQTTYPFVVKGKVGQLNAPAKIYLMRGGELLDSATLRNGQFEFKGATEWPSSAELILERQGKLRENYHQQTYFRQRDRTSVFLEAGPVVVTSADSLPHAIPGNLTPSLNPLPASFAPLARRRRLIFFIKNMPNCAGRSSKLIRLLGSVWRLFSN